MQLSYAGLPLLFVRLEVVCRSVLVPGGCRPSLACRIAGEQALRIGKTEFQGAQYRCTVVCATYGPLDSRDFWISVVDSENQVHFEAVVPLAETFYSSQEARSTRRNANPLASACVRPLYYDSATGVHAAFQWKTTMAGSVDASTVAGDSRAQERLVQVLNDYQQLGTDSREDDRQLVLRMEGRNLIGILGENSCLTLQAGDSAFQFPIGPAATELGSATLPLSLANDVELWFSMSNSGELAGRATVSFNTLLDLCNQSSDLLLPLTQPLQNQLTKSCACIWLCPLIVERTRPQATFAQSIRDFEIATIKLAQKNGTHSFGESNIQRNPGRREAELVAEVASLKAQLAASRSGLALMRDGMKQVQSASQLRFHHLQQRMVRELCNTRERVETLQQQLVAIRGNVDGF